MRKNHSPLMSKAIFSPFLNFHKTSEIKKQKEYGKHFPIPFYPPHAPKPMSILSVLNSFQGLLDGGI